MTFTIKPRVWDESIRSCTLELLFREEGPGVPMAAAGIRLRFCVFEVEGKGKLVLKDRHEGKGHRSSD